MKRACGSLIQSNVQVIQYKVKRWFPLQVAVLQADEDCEKLNRELFSGESDMSLENFIKKYKSQRCLYHLRKAKQEQFARLMRETPNSWEHTIFFNSILIYYLNIPLFSYMPEA